MAVDNKQIATDVLELVGGAENVAVATNCMTRLRLTLKDNSKADVEKIKKVKGVLGCQFAGSQLQVIIGQNVPKVLAEFVAMSGVKQGAAVDENLDAPKEKFELKNLPNIILDYLSGSMTQLIPLLMAGGLFRTIAAVLGPTMLGVLSDTDPTYTFLYTTLYEATFTFIPIYLGYAAAKKLGASPVLGMLLGGALMAPSVVSVATQEGGGIISVYGIQIAAANYQQSVLPIILSVPVLYFVEKFFKKVMPDVLSTVFTPFCTMIVTIPIAFIVLAPIGNELGNLIANALFGLADLGGIGILIVMAILGAFWQLFVVCGMHMPVILLAQVQIIAAGYDPFVFVSTNCAMAAVWGCAFGAFLKMKNPDEKGLALGYVISAIAGGVHRACALRYPHALPSHHARYVYRRCHRRCVLRPHGCYLLPGRRCLQLPGLHQLPAGWPDEPPSGLSSVWRSPLSSPLPSSLPLASPKRSSPRWRPKAKPFGHMRPYLHDRAPSGASPTGPFLQGRLIGTGDARPQGLAKRRRLLCQGYRERICRFATPLSNERTCR